MTDPQGGSGQQSGNFQLNLTPDSDALGQSTQLLEFDLTGVRLPELHSGLGQTSFLDTPKLTLSIINQSHDLQGTAHIDLIRQAWPDIAAGIRMSTALGTELNYTTHSGEQATLVLTHDVELAQGSKLEVQITTDMATGATSGTVGFKFNIP